MKRLLNHSFALALIALLIFRCVIYVLGAGREGNFLILVLIPLFAFWGIIQIIKAIYLHKKMHCS